MAEVVPESEQYGALVLPNEAGDDQEYRFVFDNDRGNFMPLDSSCPWKVNSVTQLNSSGEQQNFFVVTRINAGGFHSPHQRVLLSATATHRHSPPHTATHRHCFTTATASPPPLLRHRHTPPLPQTSQPRNSRNPRIPRNPRTLD